MRASLAGADVSVVRARKKKEAGVFAEGVVARALLLSLGSAAAGESVDVCVGMMLCILSHAVFVFRSVESLVESSVFGVGTSCRCRFHVFKSFLLPWYNLIDD